MKMAKCIQELERIKGIRKGGNGNNQYVLNPNYSDNPTQSELSNELNISQDSLGNYKKLLKLIPELQTMVENGSMKATVGYKIIYFIHLKNGLTSVRKVARIKSYNIND